MANKPRDSQRQAVYDWENSLPFPEEALLPMKWAEVMEFAGRVWSRYVPKADCIHCRGSGVCHLCGEGRCHACKGVARVQPRMPQIKDGRGCRKARGSQYDIVLPRWARTQKVICHELAHAIVDRRTISEPGHGRLFAALVLDMWVKIVGLDRKSARRAGATQKPRRVHFATAEQLKRMLGPRRKRRRKLKPAAKEKP